MSTTPPGAMKNNRGGRTVLRDASHPIRRTRQGEGERPAYADPAACSHEASGACMMNLKVVGPLGVMSACLWRLEPG